MVPLMLAFVTIVAGGALTLALVRALAGPAWATAPSWAAIALAWWLVRWRGRRRADIAA
jgi:hypothetical protein